jgi:glycosyltransferase involved in cell wall biosynthesis
LDVDRISIVSTDAGWCSTASSEARGTKRVASISLQGNIAGTCAASRRGVLVAANGNRPLADVVICTYTADRWNLLVRAVESVLTQSVLPQRMIIAVDHNDELVQRCQAKWGDGAVDSPVEIIVVANQFEGRKGSALNTALLHTRSEVIMFLDDDAAAAPDWLERNLSVYVVRPEAIAVGCAPLPEFEAPRPSWLPLEFDWVFGCHYRSLPNELAPARRLIGTSYSARRDSALAVGGFHHDDHDDMDLCERIAHRHGPAALLYEPKAVVNHHVSRERLTWSYFWRRCYYGNQCKPSLFADMGQAGDMRAELRFVIGVLLTIPPALLAALAGRRTQLVQAVVALVGLVLAGAGLIVAKVKFAMGRREVYLTKGLDPADVERLRAGT